MTALPTSWSKSRLGELTRAEYGKGLTKQSRAESGAVPVYGSAGVAGYHDEALIDGPAIVVGRKGNAGAVFLSTGPSWPIDTTYFLRLPTGVDASYVAHFLRAARLSGLDSSTAIPSLRREDLERQVVPLPPINEQRRIVAAIEEQFSHLDAAQASINRARHNVKRMARAVLWSAFDTVWPRRPLVELTDPARPICYGILKPKTSGDLSVPYVEVRSIRGGQVDLTSLHRTTEALHNEFRRSELRAGDVVLAIRGSFDRAAVIPPELEGANVSRDVARIAPTEALDARFLAYYLGGPHAYSYFAGAARGVAVRGVNIGDLRTMLVPVPPQEEQRRIVAEIDHQLSILNAMDYEVERALRRAAALRRSILEQAFSGKLVPQDPSDEPASVLLERITAGRAAEPKPSRRKRKIPA